MESLFWTIFLKILLCILQKEDNGSTWSTTSWSGNLNKLLIKQTVPVNSWMLFVNFLTGTGVASGSWNKSWLNSLCVFRISMVALAVIKWKKAWHLFVRFGYAWLGSIHGFIPFLIGGISCNSRYSGKLIVYRDG